MAAGQRSEANIRNGLRFFDRSDDFTASKVAIAAREGDEEALRALLADGELLRPNGDKPCFFAYLRSLIRYLVYSGST